MIIQKDILIELLKTDSVSVIGVLLVVLFISWFIVYKLYININSIRDEHQHEIFQLMDQHKKEIASINDIHQAEIKRMNDEYINALHDHQKNLQEVQSSYNDFINHFKTFIQTNATNR